MRVRDITTFLESIAPLHLQEAYDNAGLIVGDPEMPVNSALICLDSTPEIVAEAGEKGCNMIIAHHPIIFKGLRRLTGANYIERAVMDALRSEIAIYAIHTNLDNVLQNGVNGKLADKLDLSDRAVLSPKEGVDNGTGIGAGVVGTLRQPRAQNVFLDFLKESLELKVIRHTRLTGAEVRKVAVCGGSGSFLLPAAIEAGAQVFVTADFKYHQFFDADGKIVVADIGHYESEQFTIELIKELIRDKFPNFAAHSAETITNPIIYHT